MQGLGLGSGRLRLEKVVVGWSIGLLACARRGPVPVRLGVLLPTSASQTPQTLQALRYSTTQASLIPHHLPRIADTEATLAPRVIPGQWIVRLKAFASESTKTSHLSSVRDRNADATRFNVQVRYEYNLDEARGYSASFDNATKQQLEQLAEVDSVDPVFFYQHCAVSSITNPNVPWGLARVSNYGKVRATGPYTYKYDDAAAGEGVIVYVLDTGINDKHVQFEGRAAKGQRIFVTPPYRDTVTSDEDKQGHGTHCAGTIGSKDYGIAKKVNIVGVKVFNDLPQDDYRAGATNADIMAAIEYVVAEYKEHKMPSVINLSLGGLTYEPLDATVSAAVRAGVVVVCAAGNAERGLQPRDVETTSPARTPLAITVAASDIEDKIASFSYYGRLVDIIAPGVQIKSTWIGPNNSETETLNGTSMACPHVAGIAATILSNPRVVDKTPFSVASELLILADKNSITGLDDRKQRTIDAVSQVSL
ncbi:peptidase S8/S53 domain-containing protein [Lasiosphaeris hirsuta]|uniref:Peptidase S8/S53 domain-containing protein n=1 Tax=Lasiosphaeris hirsuta TaxID=260670 RepID=A0AA40DMR4_9PEZI|nr:peptidase S8/S53 domain-containing protein [Lasiosphaeris hirsuta]